jgi:hypothetical protein
MLLPFVIAFFAGALLVAIYITILAVFYKSPTVSYLLEHPFHFQAYAIWIGVVAFIGSIPACYITTSKRGRIILAVVFTIAILISVYLILKGI